MKRMSVWVAAGIVGLLVCALAGMGWAQGARPVPPVVYRNVLTIQHLTSLNRVKQTTPIFNTSASMGSSAQPREWGVFEVNFRTMPEWLDEIVVTYSVMAERRTTEAGPRYSFFQTTVRYADIARGDHNAAVVLAPGTLHRYADPVIGFAVEITAADGTLLATHTEIASTPGMVLPPDWWKKPEVTESKAVTKRGGLMDRSKSPFGLINIDDYEVVK